MPIDISPKPPTPKEYLGDGVYVKFEHHHLVLTVENGSRANTIYLEPELVLALVAYAKRAGAIE